MTRASGAKSTAASIVDASVSPPSVVTRQLHSAAPVRSHSFCRCIDAGRHTQGVAASRRLLFESADNVDARSQQVKGRLAASDGLPSSPGGAGVGSRGNFGGHERSGGQRRSPAVAGGGLQRSLAVAGGGLRDASAKEAAASDLARRRARAMLLGSSPIILNAKELAKMRLESLPKAHQVLTAARHPPDPTALPHPPARWLESPRTVPLSQLPPSSHALSPTSSPPTLPARRSGGRQRRGARRARHESNPALRWPDSEYIIEVFDDHGALVARYDGFEGVLV